MPNNVVKSFADKSGKSEAEVEKLWNQAIGMAKSKGLKDEAMFAMATASLKTMLKIKESIDEMTGASAVPVSAALAKGTPSGTMPCGTPYFNCSDEQFWSLHTQVRKHGGWYDKFYQDTDVAQWARQNKGKGFYLKHESGMFRKVKAN